MYTSSIQLLLMGLIALVSASIALAGNYYINHKLVRRRLAVDELKSSLIEYLKLASEYWLSDKQTEKFYRTKTEARIIAMGSVVHLRSVEVKLQSSKLNEWHTSSKNLRMDLLVAITGGTFQQSEWEPEPLRFQKATRIVTQLILDLNDAC